MFRKRNIDDAAGLMTRFGLVLTFLFLLLPVLLSVTMAFDSRTYLGRFPPPGFSLQWLRSFLSSAYLLIGLQNSLIVAATASLVSITLGALAAVALQRASFPGRDLVMAIFLAPLIVPGVILGFGLLLMFSITGLLDGLPRIIAGHVLITFPFCLRATLASLTGIRRSLTEAAMSLGANERQAFWEITLPLARTGLLTGGVFAFAVSMDDVAVALFLADPQTYTLPVALVSLMRANFDLTIAAASLVLLAVSALSTWLLAQFVGLGAVLGQGIYRQNAQE